MPSQPVHRIIVADRHAVPRPFRAFAVRSDEPCHAYEARSPLGCVHVVRTDFLDAGAMAAMAADGHGRVRLEAPGDIDYAATSLAELGALAPCTADLAGALAAALRLTRVLGDEAPSYRRSVASRIDYLASRGAGFHNDVAGHWSRCLFWVLALAVDDVEFVMPHADVRLALAAGDLLVFDPAMAHGLCRPGDAGQAVVESFDGGDNSRQIFLTGEMPLNDAQWAAVGSPWLPVERHDAQAALDLMVAEFDERSGAIKGLRALRDAMKRSLCHVDHDKRGAP